MAIYVDLNSKVQQFRWQLCVVAFDDYCVAVDVACSNDLIVRSNHCAHQNQVVANSADLFQNEFDSVDHLMCCHWSPVLYAPMYMLYVPMIVSVHDFSFDCANRKSNVSGIHKWNDFLWNRTKKSK